MSLYGGYFGAYQGVDPSGNGELQPDGDTIISGGSKITWKARPFGSDAVGFSIANYNVGFSWGIYLGITGHVGLDIVYHCDTASIGVFAYVGIGASLGISPPLTFSTNKGVFWVWGMSKVDDYSDDFLNATGSITTPGFFGGYVEMFVSPTSYYDYKKGNRKDFVWGFGIGGSIGIPQASLSITGQWFWMIAKQKAKNLQKVLCSCVTVGNPGNRTTSTKQAKVTLKNTGKQIIQQLKLSKNFTKLFKKESKNSWLADRFIDHIKNKEGGKIPFKYHD